LLVYGIISFLNGVAVNTTVSYLEAKYGQLFMSTSHALYSLGGALSAGIVALLFTVGIGSKMQIIIVAIALTILLIMLRPLLLQQVQIIHSNSGVQLPSKAIMGIAFICLVTFMAEGCVADWSALYFKQVLHTSPTWMSLGYAGFSIAMTVCRLNGDNIIAKVGSKHIVCAGSLLATVGYLLVFVATMPTVAVLGFILVGIGCSCIVPVLFSASANIPGISKVTGFAMVSGGGLIGFLVGPSLMGFIAEKSNLSFSFLALAIITILSAITALRSSVLVNK
jgi:predicted MFS family arabinose efflux permease